MMTNQIALDFMGDVCKKAGSSVSIGCKRVDPQLRPVCKAGSSKMSCQLLSSQAVNQIKGDLQHVQVS